MNPTEKNDLRKKVPKNLLNQPTNIPVRLSRKQLIRQQYKKIQSLLAEIIPSNPFYTKKLQLIKAGTIKSLQDFSQHCPFTHKEEFVQDQKLHPPYGTNLTYPLHHYTRFNQTSGTTGIPLHWLDTSESWSWMLDNWNHIYQAAGVTPYDRIFFPFSFGPFLGFWTAFESAYGLGCLCLSGGGLRSTSRLRMILDHELTVLCCTPTYAIRLAEVAKRENIDLAQSKVRLLIMAGETGASAPAARSYIESLWPGTRLVDHHGMTEVGPISYECPQQPCVLHIIETSFFPEVVNPKSGESIPEGQVGELVITNLGRTGSPVIRYRTGDLVRWSRSTPCMCGSNEIALHSGIIGRSDNMVVIRGVNIYPSAVEEIIRAVGGIAEYQVQIAQKSSMPVLRIYIELETCSKDGKKVISLLQNALHQAFALHISVSTLPSGTLPRFEFKSERWIYD